MQRSGCGQNASACRLQFRPFKCLSTQRATEVMHFPAQLKDRQSPCSTSAVKVQCSPPFSTSSSVPLSKVSMVHLRLLRAAASFLALASLHANAYWIISHSILTHDRLDPIVSPGKVASHVHTVVGASNFGPTVSVESLQASNCTTAPVQKDKRYAVTKCLLSITCSLASSALPCSSYWAPQLYSVNSNGTYTLIPNIFVNTYCADICLPLSLSLAETFLRS